MIKIKRRSKVSPSTQRIRDLTAQHIALIEIATTLRERIAKLEEKLKRARKK